MRWPYFWVCYFAVIGVVCCTLPSSCGVADADEPCNPRFGKWFFEDNPSTGATYQAACDARRSHYDAQCFKDSPGDPDCNHVLSMSPEQLSSTNWRCNATIQRTHGSTELQTWPAWLDSTGTACPVECDPSYAGDTIASADESQIAVGTARCGSTSHCKLVKTRGASIIGGVNYVSVWQNTGESCTNEDALPTETRGEKCTNLGEFEMCINPSGGGYCGYLNDQYVCLKQIKDGGCKVFGDGSRICSSSAGTPPAPDNGTPGVRATPDTQVSETNSSGVTNNYNFFGSGTVGGSSRDPGSDGTPQGGSGGGVMDGEDDQEEQGSASGGDDCSAPPSCSGDPIACAQLKQEWLTRCPPAISDSDIAGAMGTVEGVRTEEVDISDTLSESGVLPLGTAQCPQDSSFEFMGYTIELTFWPTACSFGESIRPFVIAVAYILALMILIL